MMQPGREFHQRVEGGIGGHAGVGGADIDGGETHPAGGGDVAGVVICQQAGGWRRRTGELQGDGKGFCHRLAVGVDSVNVDHLFEAVLYIQGGQHPPGVRLIGVGEDDAPLWQRLQRLPQCRVGGEHLRHRYIMDIGEEVMCIHAVGLLQAAQGGAILGIQVLAQAGNFRKWNCQPPVDVFVHPLTDCIPNAGSFGVKGVVHVNEERRDTHIPSITEMAGGCTSVDCFRCHEHP